jgi:DNA-binding IclR family transcriptional regulator
MLADLSAAERADLYALDRWQGREAERPDVELLEKELEGVRRRGFAINRDRTETGVTAIGRGLRVQLRTKAAVTVSMPTVRFSEDRLAEFVSALGLATRDIEHDLEGALELAAARTAGSSG